MKNVKGIIWVFLLVMVDQVSKWIVQNALQGKPPISIIKNVFQLQYLENKGAAFGLLQDKIVFFVILTSIVLFFIGYVYYKLPKGKKYRPLQFVLIVLASGAIGNLIDRIRFNYVVDFLYFELIDFPIFNVADCYVTISAVLLIILFLFYYKDEDLSFLSRQKAYDTPVE